MKNKSWFSIKNSTDTMDAIIHDEIGARGVSAKSFMQEIANFSGSIINVSIHSPGGSVFDGLAMYTALKNHKAKVVTNIEGVAASAASLPFMAGDERRMPDNTYLMIHNPWAVAGGDAGALRDTADFLDRIKGDLVDIYASKTDMGDTDLNEMLDAETWLDPEEAKNLGFATHVDDSVQVAALSKDFEKHFSSIPQAIKRDPIRIDSLNHEDIHSIQDFEKLLREVGGFSNSASKKLVQTAKSIIRREGEGETEAALALLNKFSLT